MATILRAVGLEAFIEFNIPKAQQSDFLAFLTKSGSPEGKTMSPIAKQPYASAPLVQLYSRAGAKAGFIEAVTIDETNFLAKP